ncbi:hypothetical protein PVK06_007460 [Gossypium arboreum]|uniref:Uncharacterized protein n=1 Tax=Gossypium arboreum TaxID=29729 RepID=A0ABR0QHJ6_GOSAR|nr:hypothetical protein PVK06_007460 [Gossypium arboreum]
MTSQFSLGAVTSPRKKSILRKSWYGCGCQACLTGKRGKFARFTVVVDLLKPLKEFVGIDGSRSEATQGGKSAAITFGKNPSGDKSSLKSTRLDVLMTLEESKVEGFGEDLTEEIAAVTTCDNGKLYE